MTLLTLLQESAPAAKDNPPLEEILSTMQRVGSPRLGCMNNEWYCACDMHITTPGGTFTVRSDYNHISPVSAARECLQRVAKAMEGAR